MKRITAFLAAALAYGFHLAPAQPREKRLASWQLVVGTDARCFTSGDTAILRLIDGVTIKRVATLRPVHINTADGIVTFADVR